MKIHQEEILAISRQFNIPVQKIIEVLAKPLKLILEEKSSRMKDAFLPFDDFEKEYILAQNETEEVFAINKFLQSCREAKNAKLLFDLCPKNQTELQEKIIHEWIILSKNLEELREPKSLVKKNTADSILAYQKYLKFFM
ncbi:MAG: hypothetical protein WCN88_00810 [Candidatus Falkowbacteria bacterium]